MPFRVFIILWMALCLLSCGVKVRGPDGSIPVTLSQAAPPNSPSAPAASFVLSATGYDACATTGGAAYCWGYNPYGQLGDGTTTDALVPTLVTGLTSGVTNISPGVAASCAVVNGSALCWGSGSYTGDGTANQHLIPTQVAGLTSGVTSISSGTYHSCAIRSGAAYCWGNNSAGQLGDGTMNSSDSPVAVSGLANGVSAISTDNGSGFGYSHSCAIKSGVVWCWGDNTYGELGDNSTTSSSVPVLVQGLPAGVTQLSSGASHSCAIANGAAYCWGENSGGEVGNGAALFGGPVLTAVPVVGLSSGVTQIYAGGAFTCAVVNGSAQCWGDNSFGELGDGVGGGATSSSVPIQVTGLTSGVTSIAAGVGFACAVKSGSAYCWGANTNGCIGNNTSSNTQYFAPISVMNWP